MHDQFRLDEDEGGRWSPMPFGKSIDSGLFDESHLVDEVAAYQDYQADAEGYVELSFDF